MLRLHRPVRPLTEDEVGWALAECARDAGPNVFPAARLRELGAESRYGQMLVHRTGDGAGLCWASANVVPVNLRPEDVEPVAIALRRWRHRSSSLFGPAEAVLALWRHLEPAWGPAREVRANQPLLTATAPSAVEPDAAVRAARAEELDLVVPAAAAMFTEEIGYPPFTHDPTPYRQSVANLIAHGRCFVRVEGGRVVFKADVGSVANGVAQVQGVWVAPERRGQGVAAPAMEAVNRMVLDRIAPTVNLYVNDYNVRARATYARIGYRQTGTFATVLL